MRQSRWLLLSFFILIVDQASRFLLNNPSTSLIYGDLFSSLPQGLLIQYPGFDHQQLQDPGNWQLFLFLILSLMVMGLLFNWLYQTRPEQQLEAFALSLSLGSVVSYIINELIDSYSIQYIYKFHLADLTILLGLTLMILKQLLPEEIKRTPPS